MPSDINREELKMETIAKFEVGKTYTGPVYDVDGKRVDVVCIKRTAKYVTMARGCRTYKMKILANDRTERLMGSTGYFSADGIL